MTYFGTIKVYNEKRLINDGNTEPKLHKNVQFDEKQYF